MGMGGEQRELAHRPRKQRGRLRWDDFTIIETWDGLGVQFVQEFGMHVTDGMGRVHVGVTA